MKENETLYVSKAGYQKLQDQLQTVLDEKKYLEQEMGESGNVDPDLRENPYFMGVRTRLQGEIPRRIVDLKEKIAIATIIEEQPFFQQGKTDTTFIGSKITIKDNSGETYSFTILGPVESDPKQDIISYLSPIGMALLGKKLEETIEINTPNGTQCLQIKKIEKGI